MKTCTKCGETKSLDMFSPHAKTKDKKRSWCKACCSAAYREYAKTDSGAATIRAWNASDNGRNRKRKYFRDHYSRNADEQRQRVGKYREENKDKVSATLARSKAKHIGHVYARNTERTKAIKLATPKWEDGTAVANYYSIANALRRNGLDVCVDHIVPLKSKHVCGLHTVSNLQIISSRENAIKNNRIWPDM